MFAFMTPIPSNTHPSGLRALDPYTLPVENGDTVKVRTTHQNVNDPDSNVAARVGQFGKVVGVQTHVMVQFEDGSTQMFDRDELSYRLPDSVKEVLGLIPPQEPWKG